MLKTFEVHACSLVKQKLNWSDALELWRLWRRIAQHLQACVSWALPQPRAHEGVAGLGGPVVARARKCPLHHGNHWTDGVRARYSSLCGGFIKIYRLREYIPGNKYRT